jgi:hypothetical protein
VAHGGPAADAAGTPVRPAARSVPAGEDESALRVLPLLRSVTAEWFRRLFGRVFGARRDRITRTTPRERQ